MDGVSSSRRGLTPDVLGIGSLGCQGLGQAVIDDARDHSALIDRILSAQLFAPEIKEICFYLKQYPEDARPYIEDGIVTLPVYMPQLIWQMVEGALTRFQTLHEQYVERARSLVKRGDKESNVYTGMRSFLPTPDWLVERDEGIKAGIKRNLIGQKALPETIYSEMVDWSVGIDHISRWLKAFAAKCSTTVPEDQAINIIRLPREVRVALITGLAGIVTMLDDTAEVEKQAACQKMADTLLGLNRLQDGLTNLLAVADSKNVIDIINRSLPQQARLILPPLD